MSSGWHKQRALERRMFGPEPKVKSPKKRSPVCGKQTQAAAADEYQPRPGHCIFCGNSCSLAYARDEWRCYMCGRVYFTLDKEPDGSIVTLFRDPPPAAKSPTDDSSK